MAIIDQGTNGSGGGGANQGDRKWSDRLTDHFDWILLDGRLKSALTAAQQAVATTLGYGVNIPDMRGRMPVGAGGTLAAAINAVGGSLTLAQNQLPNVTLAATPNGTFTPSGTVATTVVAKFHSATGGGFNGGWIQLTDRAGFFQTAPSEMSVSASFTGSAGALPNFTTASINGGVVQQNFIPPYLAGNWFVWLGTASNTVTVSQPLSLTTSGSGTATFNPGTGVLNIPAQPAILTLTDVAAVNWDVSISPTANWLIGGSARSLTISNPIAGSTYLVKVKQDATGGRTIASYPAGTIWSRGVVPSLSIVPNAIDILTFYYDGANYFGLISYDFR